MDLYDLREMFRHNTWANERVLTVCSGLEPGALTAAVPGADVGTIHDALVHLAWVELGYLWIIDHRPFGALQRREALEVCSLRRLSETLAWIGRSYIEWIEHADISRLRERLPASCWDEEPPLTARRTLLHVLTHSATHRTQVFAVLSAMGVAVPDLDYLRMVQEEAS